MNLFHSARLKLTGFYFAILVVFCLVLTFGVRAFTSYELQRADVARGGVVHHLIERFDSGGDDSVSLPDGSFFVGTEQRQSDLARQRLNHDILFIDVSLLALGAVASYWYAGRTLRPIERAHEEQKRFTADASHELRTPLASLRLENEVFLRQKHFAEKDARVLIASNLEEVARLERLSTTLLALNQYEHGSVTKRPFPIADLVRDAVMRVKRTDSAKRKEFALDVVPATVQADRESLTELLGILLDNAVKYDSSKGPVEVSGRTSRDGYVLDVRDHGSGIPDVDLPRIFERMYRGDKARSNKVPGHGIGLSLARQIAQANDASLTAANHPDGGAVFTLTLRL